MKSRVPQIIFLLAIGLGVATTYIVYQWMEQQTSLADAQELATLPVAVAAVNLNPGTTLSDATIKVIDWPADSVPAGAFSSTTVLRERVVISPVLAGEMIIEGKLAAPGTGGGLTAIISPGKRAMSVRVDEIIGVAGFVVPGSTVDVLVTLEDRENSRLDAATQMILQNVKVLTSGQKIVNEKHEPSVVNVVTLEVFPAEAEKLALAASRGRLQLALRNQIDSEHVQTNAIHTPELIRSKPVAAAPKAPRPQPLVVEVIRGGKRSNQEF